MTSPPPHNGSRPRINWAAARAYFHELPEERRTFKAVADRFGVSDVRVSQVARRDDWIRESQEIDRRAQVQAIRMLARSRVERIARALELHDRAQDVALDMMPLNGAGAVDVDAIPAERLPRLDQMLEKIPGLFKMAELAAGEATDRVAIAEVQPVLIAFARIAVVHARPEARGEVLRDLAAVSAGLVALDSAA